MPHSTAHADRAQLAVVAVFNARSRRQRSEIGAFATPAEVARFMATQLAAATDGPVRVVDPGCGAGGLAAAAVDALLDSNPGRKVELVLVDREADFLAAAAGVFADTANVTVTAVCDDYVTWAAGAVDRGEQVDLVIANPPYQKISARADGGARKALVERHTTGSTNEYAASLGLSVRLLRPGGRLAYLTPRSYMSGAYFRRFRRELLAALHLDRIHRFESRREVFDAADEVLQETVVLVATRRSEDDDMRQTDVLLSVSDGIHDLDDAQTVTAPMHLFAGPWAGEGWALPGDAEELTMLEEFAGNPLRLRDLDLTVFTGPLVPHRPAGTLRDTPQPDTAPLLWLQHVRPGAVTFPLEDFGKAQYVDTAAAAVSAHRDAAVLVRRFSAKEERKRVVAAGVPAGFAGGWVGENHLNVITGGDDALLAGLGAYLNSSRVDAFFRLCSGNTQVSATELRELPVPPADVLRRVAADLGDPTRQEDVDAAVTRAWGA